MKMVQSPHALEAEPVSLALVPYKIGMGGTEHNVQDLGKIAHDRWQRIKGRVRYPWCGERRPNVSKNGAPLRPKFVLAIVRIGKGHVRNAVRDQINLVHRRFVNVAKKLIPFSAMDTTRAESLITSWSTSFCSRVGSLRILCKV